jgi:UDP-GlcNAc:undecaprenyl-phosphate/decaprenyl-phosphate GlcNAc-1-phosphate transferase
MSSMSTALFFSFLGSLLVCIALIPALTVTADRLHVLDFPGGRREHPSPIAKVGGIAFGAGTFLAILLWSPKDPVMTACLMGAFIILLFGVWDDRVGLYYPAKFAGQILAAATMIVVAGVRLNAVPFLPETEVPLWLSAAMALIVIVAVTNAVNLADGLDGLAGGLTLISFCGMAFLAYQADDSIVMLMMVSVLGALLGFLRFNSYPAKIFMGDAGGQFLGFYLAVSAIVLTDPARGPYSLPLALFLWGLPLLDTAGVMIQRLREGRSPFVGDRNHLHHKLLALGLSHRGAVTMIYAAQLGVVGLAWCLQWQNDAVLLGVYALIAVSVLSLFVFPVGQRAKALPADQSKSAGMPVPDEDLTFAWFRALPIRLLVMIVPAFLLVAVFIPHAVPRDVGTIAAVVATAIGAGLLTWPKARPWLVRTGLYLGSTFVLYLCDGLVPSLERQGLTPLDLFFVGIGGLVLLAIKFTARGGFETTPLDYLVVVLAVLFPVLPAIQVGDVNLSVLTAKLIVMFLALELILHTLARRLTQFGLLSLWVLVFLGLRAWW